MSLWRCFSYYLSDQSNHLRRSKTPDNRRRDTLVKKWLVWNVCGGWSGSATSPGCCRFEWKLIARRKSLSGLRFLGVILSLGGSS